MFILNQFRVTIFLFVVQISLFATKCFCPLLNPKDRNKDKRNSQAHSLLVSSRLLVRFSVFRNLVNAKGNMSESNRKRKRPSSFKHIGKPIISPPNGIKKYKAIKLDNGLNVLLVSDPNTSQAAAAVTVRVGSFLDPLQVPGLAHLLEHMVFVGNGLKDYLSNHGGDAHASTKMEHSTFYMGVENTSLEGALKRFAQLFTYPLMSIDHIKKEIITIDSEFELHKQNDDCRLDQLMAHTSAKGHPFNRFAWGNKVSLSNMSYKSLQTCLLTLFNENVFACNMHLVVVADATFSVLETWVDKYFSPIKKGPQSFPKSNPACCSIWDSDTSYILESVCEKQTLRVSWMIPPLSNSSYLERPDNCLVQLLCQETKGSLFSLFKEKGWIINLNVFVGANSSFADDGGDHSFSSTSFGRLFTILLDITKDGVKKKYDIVKYIYHYLQLVRNKTLPSHVMREYRMVMNMKFQCLDTDDTLVNDPRLFAQRLAENMLTCPVRHVVSMDFMNQVCTNEAFAKLLDYFCPENMRMDLLSDSFKTKEFKIEPWFNSRYKEEKIPPSLKETWKNISEVHSSFHFPGENEFVPSSFSIRSQEDVEEKTILLVDENLFYRREEGLSSAFFCLDLKIGSDVKEHMMAKMFVELLKDDLREIIFKGTEAYLNTLLSLRDDNRLELKFDGYREKLCLFIKTIWEKLIFFLPRMKSFEIIKENMMRDFYTDLLDLSLHSDLLLSEEIGGSYACDEKFNSLKRINFEDLSRFIPLMRSEICIKGICFGDLLESEVKEISDVLKPAIRKELRSNEVIIRDYKLGTDVHRRNVMTLNESERNSLTRLNFQLHCEKDQLLRVTALLYLFKGTIEEEVWKQLREKENLGYDVSCCVRSKSAMKSFSVDVISPMHDPGYLLSRIYNFIGLIGDFLESLSKKTFRSYQRAVLSTLPDDSGIYLWQLIVEDCYLDDFHMGLRNSILGMTKKDVIGFYKRYFIQSSEYCSRVEICVWGCKRRRGTVKWFDTQKGFGFITPEEGCGDFFFHQSSILFEGYLSLAADQSVEFDVGIDNKGRPKAIKVSLPDGGRGGGSGGRDCYKCGEAGHMARECYLGSGVYERGRGVARDCISGGR